MKVKLILCFSIYFLLVENMVSKPSKFEDVKLTKQIERGFRVKDDLYFDISNKYGRVSINAWEKDSVAISVTVTVFGKTDYEAQLQIDRIDFSFRHSSNFLSVETQFDQGNSLVRDFWNSVSDASRSISSKSKVVVDYDIWLPSTASVTISNKFGDVYASDYKGRFRLDLSYGDLMAGQFQGFTDLTIGFGKGKVRAMAMGKLTLRGASMDLLSSEKLDISASSSDITLGEVKTLFIDSRNDKVFIENINEISGKGYFSNIHIQRLVTQLDASMFYGGVSIAHADLGLERFKITSKNTTVNLHLDLASTFDFMISGREERIYLPAEMKELKKEFDHLNDRNVYLTGSFGFGKEKGVIDINADNGEVIITMQPTVPLSTNKKN